TLGQTGLVISKLAFGGGTFTLGDTTTPGAESVAKVGPELADRLVGRAIDAGITLFDTSDYYAAGESEVLLGRALKPHRDDIVLTTKCGFRTGAPLVRSGLNRRHIHWSVDQSLRRLGTDWIDVYVMHLEDPYTPLEETVAALDDIVRAGKVRYLGVSNWSAWRTAACLELQRAGGLAPFTHAQMLYSLLTRDVERDVIPMLARYGCGLTAYSPLAFGFLSGKYSRENMSDTDNRLSGPLKDMLPFDKEQGFAVVECMRKIGEDLGASVAQVAVAWLLAKSSVDSVILGVTKPHQLEDNLGAADLVLDPSVVNELDSLTPLAPAYPNWYWDQLGDHTRTAALTEGVTHA